MKKVLSILLSAALVLAFGTVAFASSEASGETTTAEPTVAAAAEAYPDQTITLDGVAMGQVNRLVTIAAIAYDGGELDETHTTNAGVTEEDGVTYITSTDDNTVGIAIRNTGAFVLGGTSDPELVAEKINFSYITGEYYGDWDAFCEAMGYDSGMTLEEIAQDIVDNGGSSSYTNLGLEAPETVVLNDYVIDLSGVGGNDMGGYGAGVYVTDNAVAELNNFRIITRGPARGTIFTRFGAQVTVNDSTVYAVSDPTATAAQGCPPGLFLEGAVRATNAVGASVATYNNSVVVSIGWGALSTDSDDLYTNADTPTELHINDSYIAVLTSGYGAYSDGGARDYFEGTCIDVPDYAAVETGTGIVSYTDCVINAGMYGVMTHSGHSTGDIVFTDTELHVGEAGVMLRDTANNVVFDNCTIAFDGTYTINPEFAAAYGADVADIDAEFGTTNGVSDTYEHTVFRADDSNCIVKLIHNSDGGSGTESTGAAPVVTIKNSDMTGDILNTAAMEGDEYTATSGPAGEGVRTPRSLEVTLDAATVTGAISLGQDTWTVTHFASGANDSQDIGYASSTELGAYHDDGYGLSLTLSNGAVWNVTETSYLTELVIDDTSSVNGTITVDGEEVTGAGTYTGEIVVTAGAASAEASSEEPAAAAGDTSEAAYQEYLKSYVDACPAVTDEQYEEFAALIDAGDYVSFPVEMCFTDAYWGYTAATYDEFVAAGGNVELPDFDPTLTADAEA